MKWLAFVAMIGLTVMAYFAPPINTFPEPELARMIFFHLPCAFLTVGFVLFSAVCAIKYLSTREIIWEYRGHAANAVSLGVAAATLATGILFSKVQWGAWWHWDPRQTSFLIVLLLLGAYFAVRMAFDDETTRARAAATYSSLTLLPILFLVFVFPRLPQVVKNSLHPSTTVQQGGFSREYWTVVLGVFVVLIWTFSWIYKIHVRTSLLEKELVDQDGKLEAAGNRTTAHRVDRSVSVREQS
ncbi:MAG: cytochrome c biogenesis protein CcsA [Armatimonadetes bacterium]|nr:cytochrome c biogenesis protein CcsA [Armatimonadota bacterium]